MALQLDRADPDIRMQIKKMLFTSAKTIEFPDHKVANPDRRMTKVKQNLHDSSNKEYQPKTRQVRVSEDTSEVRNWLKNQYTNDDDQMVCQLCKCEMPFKKLDGEYYFEAVEVLTGDFLPKEHESQFLALCPLCAAKYKVLAKSDENTMQKLHETLLNSELSETSEVPLKMGTEDVTIRFCEVHILDLKTVLDAYSK